MDSFSQGFDIRIVNLSFFHSLNIPSGYCEQQTSLDSLEINSLLALYLLRLLRLVLTIANVSRKVRLAKDFFFDRLKAHCKC